MIGVEVLFYGHGDGTWPGGKPGLILNLDVEMAGGNQPVVTDKSWLALLDRAHPPGHYKRWFLRRCRRSSMPGCILHGWDTVDCQPDGSWVAAQEIALSARQGRRRAERMALVGRQRGPRRAGSLVAAHAADSADVRNADSGKGAGALRPCSMEARSGRLVRYARCRIPS